MPQRCGKLASEGHFGSGIELTVFRGKLNYCSASAVTLTDRGRRRWRWLFMPQSAICSNHTGKRCGDKGGSRMACPLQIGKPVLKLTGAGENKNKYRPAVRSALVSL